MSHIHGALHAEAMGPAEGPPMVFVHSNSTDSSIWMFQMAHFSSWYRCVAVDLPGYGRSPGADEGLTLEEIADACWAAADSLAGGSAAVLVGCSIGSTVVQHMFHRRPSSTSALVVCGTGYLPVKDFARRKAAMWARRGLDYRHDYVLEGLSPAFAASELGQWLVRVVTERNDTADLNTIIRLYGPHGEPDPDWLQRDLTAPVLILSGELDEARAIAPALAERLPNAKTVVVEAAGHTCQFERPWAFDEEMIGFLKANGHGFLP